MANPDHRSTAERKRQLALTLATTRVRLTTSGRDLRQRLNPGRAAGNYVKNHPLQIFGTTAAAVAALTYFLRPRRRQQPLKSGKSFRRRLLGWVMLLCKQAIRFWVLKHTKTFLGTKPVILETDSLLGP